MLRCLLTLAALAASAAAAPAADKPIIIRWHGQSMFEIISPDGVRIVTDPHAIEVYGRKSLSADLVLMTHFHTDHTRTEVIENLKSAKQINALKKLDPAGRRTDFNVVDEKLKDVRVQSLGSYHDTMNGMKRGLNGIFVIEIAGVRIVHLGDLGHVLNREQVRKIGRVDVLLIPIGGIYTINGLDAQKVVEQLKPRRYIIPMHYANAVYRDLLNLEETHFLDDQEMGKVERFRATNEIQIDPKAAPPKEPIVAILHWKKLGK